MQWAVVVGDDVVNVMEAPETLRSPETRRVRMPSGREVDVTESGPGIMMPPPGGRFLAAPPGCAAGWRLVAGVLVAPQPAPRDLGLVRAEALARLEDARLRTEALAAAGLPLGAPPPDERKLTLYAAKQEWARQAKLGDTDAQAHLAGEAVAWGITVDALADTILAKALTANTKIAAIETDRVTAAAAVTGAGSLAAVLAAEDAGVSAMESRL